MDLEFLVKSYISMLNRLPETLASRILVEIANDCLQPVFSRLQAAISEFEDGGLHQMSVSTSDARQSRSESFTNRASSQLMNGMMRLEDVTCTLSA